MNLTTNPLGLVRALVLASLAAFALAGCNTIAGAGEDLQDAGEAVERAAEKTKKKL